LIEVVDVERKRMRKKRKDRKSAKGRRGRREERGEKRKRGERERKSGGFDPKKGTSALVGKSVEGIRRHQRPTEPPNDGNRLESPSFFAAWPRHEVNGSGLKAIILHNTTSSRYNVV
jgi:hypothetical protein